MRNTILRFVSLIITVFMILSASACSNFITPQSDNTSSEPQKTSSASKADKQVSSKPSESSTISKVEPAVSSQKKVTSKPKKEKVNSSSSEKSTVTDDDEKVNFYDDITNWPIYDDLENEDKDNEVDKDFEHPVAKINKITSLDDLLQLESSVRSGYSYKDETVSLECDIDLSGIEWRPIGISGASFKGKFKGNNHTISNLTITTSKNATLFSSNSAYIGLFGFVEDGEIIDLNVENANIDIKDLPDETWSNIGAIVGLMLDRGGNISLSECRASGKINVAENSSAIVVVGGITGGFHTKQDTSFCMSYLYSTVDITADCEWFSGGGIAGSVALARHDSQKFYISDMVYIGSIDYKADWSEISGFSAIFHTENKARIENCFLKLEFNGFRGNIDIGIVIGDQAVDCAALSLSDIYGIGIYNSKNVELKFVGRNFSPVAEYKCVYTAELPENVPFDTEMWDLTNPALPTFKY